MNPNAQIIHGSQANGSGGSSLSIAARSASSEALSGPPMRRPRLSFGCTHTSCCSTRARTLWKLATYPRMVTRVAPDITIAPPPPVRWNARTVCENLSYFHGAELTLAAVELVYIFLLLFHTLRIDVSELRDRLSGWLIFSLMIGSTRCSLLSFILEDGRAILHRSSDSQIRHDLVALVKGSRMAVLRGLHVAAVLWSLLAWQLLYVYADSRRQLANGRANLSRWKESAPPQHLRYHPRPLIAESQLETSLMQWIMRGALVSTGFLAIHCMIWVLTYLYFLYRKKVPTLIWLSFFTAQQGEAAIPTESFLDPSGMTVYGRRRVTSVVPENLSTFPLLEWKPEWTTADDQATSCCSVCLATFEPKDLVRVLPCTHTFHQDCIDTWLSSNTVCPLRCDVNLQQPFDGHFQAEQLESRLPAALASAIMTKCTENTAEPSAVNERHCASTTTTT